MEQDLAKAMAAITESRPPVTDKFTYLTILESHLSPAILPTLNDILSNDADLTQEVGWDLVYNLVGMRGSESCLETIARLGNPREVILKVLEALELLAADEDGYAAGAENKDENVVASATDRFVMLLGMLAILHRRIQTRFPSRFLSQTLQVVFGAYEALQTGLGKHERTASVIHLVRALSGRSARPALPIRKSSVNVATLDGQLDKNDAPDPEAEIAAGKDGQEVGQQLDEHPVESELQTRMLLSFATCVLEAYVDRNDMAWAPRLVEFYDPDKIVPGRKTFMAAFREDKELSERDAMVGQLAALAKDLSLTGCSKSSFLDMLYSQGLSSDPLAAIETAASPKDIPLSIGGCVCLLAYWVFSCTIFDADQPLPDMYIFPDHFSRLQTFLKGDHPDAQILRSPGVTQAIVATGLWLEAEGRISAQPTVSVGNDSNKISDEPTPDFMSHLLALSMAAVYHPVLHVRNAAVVLAGKVLHADPVDKDRLHILEDLFENCMFAHLKACAVTWLREELIAAAAAATKVSVFATPQALDTVQYALFPSLSSLPQFGEDAADQLAQTIAESAPFFLQAVNFAIFLWGGSNAGGRWAHLIPSNMAAAVAERWYLPLRAAVGRLIRGGPNKENQLADTAGLLAGPVLFEMEVLSGRLELLGNAKGFRAEEGVVMSACGFD